MISRFIYGVKVWIWREHCGIIMGVYGVRGYEKKRVVLLYFSVGLKRVG